MEDLLYRVRYFIEDHLKLVVGMVVVFLLIIVGLFLYLNGGSSDEVLVDKGYVMDTFNEMDLSNYSKARQGDIQVLKDRLDSATTDEEVSNIHVDLVDLMVAATYELTEFEEGNELISTYIMDDMPRGDGVYYLYMGGDAGKVQVELLQQLKDEGYPVYVYVAKYDQQSGVYYRVNYERYLGRGVESEVPMMYIIKDGKVLDRAYEFNFDTVEELEEFVNRGEGSGQ